MSYTNGPAILDTLRTQIAATTTWTNASLTASNIHYPALDASGGIAGTEAVLVAQGLSRRRYAAGAGGILGGTLIVHLYSGDRDVGQLEDFASDLANDLVDGDQPIANLELSDIGVADGPTSADDIADEGISTITITFSFGLEG